MKSQSRLMSALLIPGLLIAIWVGQSAAQDQHGERKLFTTYSLEETYLEDEGPVEDLIEMRQNNTTNSEGVSTSFVDPGRFYSATCTVGPRSSDIIFKCTGFNFASAYPQNVFCQPRQGPDQNLDFGWPDQFGCQIVETSRDFVRFRIRRFDNGTGSSGWGQNLRVGLLIMD